MSKNSSNQPDFSASAAEQQAGYDPGSIQTQLTALQAYIDQQIQTHIHNGTWASRIQLNTDIGGLFQTVSTAPTNSTVKPQNIFDQIQIYVNGSTYRLYWYDAVGQNWHYVTATA